MSYCPKGISDLSLCPWVYSHHLGSSQHYLLPGLQWQLTGFLLSTLPPCNPFSTQSLRTQTGEYCCLSHNSLFPWLQRSYTMARAHFFNEMFDCFSPYSPHYTHTGFSLVSGTQQALSCLLALALLFPLPRNIFISVSHDWFLFSLWFLETSSQRPHVKPSSPVTRQLFSCQVSRYFPRGTYCLKSPGLSPHLLLYHLFTY